MVLMLGCQSTYYAMWEKMGKEKRHLLRDQVDRGRRDRLLAPASCSRARRRDVIDAVITCVDCGGDAHLLNPPDPNDVEPLLPGDVLIYRCADCNDRWDVVYEAIEDA